MSEADKHIYFSAHRQTWNSWYLVDSDLCTVLYMAKLLWKSGLSSTWKIREKNTVNQDLNNYIFVSKDWIIYRT
jgi:hypothetical protein